MVAFWQTRFHCCDGNNLIAAQCFNMTGNKNVPGIAASEMTWATQ